MALNTRKGYTLAEAMIAIAIVGGLSAVAAPLLTRVTNFWRQTMARNTIERDVRSSLDIINRFTRQAVASSVVIDQPNGQPPCSRLTFAMIQGNTVSFYQSGNKLYMTDGSTRSLLSSNIAYIAFTYPRSDDITLISVAITTQASTYLGGRKALQLSIQKVRIMN